MDSVIIEVPLKFIGLSLNSMEITEGKVANFYIPLAFTKTNCVALTKILGDKDSIERLLNLY